MRGDGVFLTRGVGSADASSPISFAPEPTANGLVHLKPKTASLDVVDGLDAKFPDMGGQADVPEAFGILLTIGDPPLDEVFQGLAFF